MTGGETIMDLALKEAEAAARRGEVPVGAVLVDSRSGEVLARTGNRVEELGDPTAHAEMLAIRAGAQALGLKRLTDADLYVTLEPCAMCAAAISFARLRRLYSVRPIRRAAPWKTARGFSGRRPAIIARRSMVASARGR